MSMMMWCQILEPCGFVKQKTSSKCFQIIQTKTLNFCPLTNQDYECSYWLSLMHFLSFWKLNFFVFFNETRAAPQLCSVCSLLLNSPLYTLESSRFYKGAFDGLQMNPSRLTYTLYSSLHTSLNLHVLQASLESDCGIDNLIKRRVLQVNAPFVEACCCNCCFSCCVSSLLM